MSNKNKRCFNCLWFATVDSRYSNYTVECTTCHCLKDKNGYLPCEESYSWEIENSPTKHAPAVMVAEECIFFCDKGDRDQVRLDVDREVSINDFCEELQQAVKDYGLL